LPLIIGTLLGWSSARHRFISCSKSADCECLDSRGSNLDHDLFAFFPNSVCAIRLCSRNNIVQTAGSAGESIAFGLGVTMPAIMILGFDLESTRVMLVAILGGLIGILMMIPCVARSSCRNTVT